MAGTRLRKNDVLAAFNPKHVFPMPHQRQRVRGKTTQANDWLALNPQQRDAVNGRRAHRPAAAMNAPRPTGA
jgi:hypothetical protein